MLSGPEKGSSSGLTYPFTPKASDTQGSEGHMSNSCDMEASGFFCLLHKTLKPRPTVTANMTVKGTLSFHVTKALSDVNDKTHSWRTR